MIENDVVVVADDVVNMNVDPPLAVVGVMEPELVDEIAKSAATPVVAPDAPETLTVHTMLVPARAGLVLVQDRLDAVVGVPYTTKFSNPPLIPVAPISTFTVNDVVVEADDVENVNVAPPFDVTGVIDGVEVDDTVKSAAAPVPAPDASRTLMVHAILVPALAGLVLVHESMDAVVGTLYTTYVGAPFIIVTPPTCTVTPNAVLLLVGVVENVKVDPPLAVVGVMLPTVDDTAKSAATPVVAPDRPDTVIVQVIAAPTR